MSEQLRQTAEAIAYYQAVMGYSKSQISHCCIFRTYGLMKFITETLERWNDNAPS